MNICPICQRHDYNTLITRTRCEICERKGFAFTDTKEVEVVVQKCGIQKQCRHGEACGATLKHVDCPITQRKETWSERARALLFDCSFCVDAPSIKKEIEDLLKEFTKE